MYSYQLNRTKYGYTLWSFILSVVFPFKNEMFEQLTSQDRILSFYWPLYRFWWCLVIESHGDQQEWVLVPALWLWTNDRKLRGGGCRTCCSRWDRFAFHWMPSELSFRITLTDTDIWMSVVLSVIGQRTQALLKNTRLSKLLWKTHQSQPWPLFFLSPLALSVYGNHPFPRAVSWRFGQTISVTVACMQDKRWTLRSGSDFFFFLWWGRMSPEETFCSAISSVVTEAVLHWWSSSTHRTRAALGGSGLLVQPELTPEPWPRWLSSSLYQGALFSPQNFLISWFQTLLSFLSPQDVASSQF